MRLEFKPQAFEDLQFWVQTNPKLAKRLLRLIEETLRDPFGGVGKPEPLRGELSGGGLSVSIRNTGWFIKWRASG